MEKKICSKCKVEKDVCEFYKNNRNPNIYRGQCKKCMNEFSFDYNKKNTKIISEKGKQFRLENPDINKEKCRIYKKKITPTILKNGWIKIKNTEKNI